MTDTERKEVEELAKFKTYPSYKPENKRKYHKKYWENNPWVSHYQSAKDRCIRVKNPHYIFYGGKGVKMLMTPKDFKFLWYRDLAFLMKEPSIDRVDSNSHYELRNCKFIECEENRKKGRIARWAKT